MDRVPLRSLASGYLVRDEAGPYNGLTVDQLGSLTIPREPHLMDAHRLLFVRAGRGIITVDFETLDCGPGTLLYTRPGQVQKIGLNTDGAAPWSDAIEVRFAGSTPTRFAIRVPNVVDDAFGTRHWTLADEELDLFDRSFRELADEYANMSADGSEVTGEVLRLLLTTLLLRITRLASAKQTNTVVLASPVYHRFRQELEKAFAEIHSANEYAHRLGYSARTLNRACIEESGHTAKELIDVRIGLEAKRMLTYTDNSVASIARALGFTEPANFGKYFARMAGGVTPGEFRRSHRGLW